MRALKLVVALLRYGAPGPRAWPVWLLVGLGACAGNSQPPVPDIELTVAAIALGADLSQLSQATNVTLAPTMEWQRRPDSAAFVAWLAGQDPFNSPRRQRIFPLVRRFWEANATTRKLGTLDVPGVGRMVPSKKAPNDGLRIHLTRVGFSVMGDSALVGFESTCPGLCGSWELWLYVRTNQKWKRVDNVVLINY